MTAGGTLYLRWLDVNDPNTDPVLAIDNFTFVATNFQAVAISNQPQDTVHTAGEPAGFSVGATGVPLFYQWLSNGVPISGATGSNYSLAATTTNLSGTGYSVIVSNSLNSVTSRVATLTVFPDLSWTLVSLTNTVWRYNESGTDLGTVWKEPGYDDTAWPQGRGVLAWEDTPATLAVIGPLTNTILSLSNAAGERIVTYYFRTTFVVTNPAETATLTFSNLIDDGAIVYMNGTELYRVNMTNAPVTYTNQALAVATEGVFVATNFYVANLLPGTNVLAVEVHQFGAASSDVVMGLSVKAQSLNGGPVVILQSPQNQTVNSGGSAAFSVLASGYAPLSYQWLCNGTLLPGATGPSLALAPISLLQDGYYWVRISNGYGAVLSRPARLHVSGLGTVAFYEADFAGGAGAEWSNTKTETTPGTAERFLGQFANNVVGLRFANLPAHTNVIVTFDLFIIETWNGNGTAEPEPGPDYWNLALTNGPTLLHTTFKGYDTSASPYDSTQAFPDQYPAGTFPGRTGADETNTLGYVWQSEPFDTVYRGLTYSATHNGTALQINFSGSGLQGIGDESWGVDNVKVYLNNGTVAGWPVILAQPQSQAVPTSSHVVLSVTATGSGLLHYQWSHDGTLLANATNATLDVNGFSTNDLGSYSVTVSNSYGVVSSGKAGLTLPPLPLQWATAIGGTATQSAYRRGLGTDSSGNIFVAGVFQGTNIFSGTSLVSQGGDDIFLAKLNPAGEMVWIRQAGGTSDDTSRGVGVDQTGNIYMAGTFSGTANFGSNQITSAGSNDVFVAKYDNNGTLLWVRQAGGIGDDEASSVAIDATGNCFVTGWFANTANFGATNLVSAGGWDIFVAKLSPSGDLQWVRQIGGTYTWDWSWSVAADSSGNCYVAGKYGNTASFGPTNLTSTGGQDAFVAKYDGDGTLLWVRSGGGSTGDDIGVSVTTDADGACYAAGIYVGTATFSGTTLQSAGDWDNYLVKYKADGTMEWIRSAGGGGYDHVWAVAVDSTGGLIMAGYFSGTNVFTQATIGSAGDYDIFLAKYTSDGVLEWVQSAGGAGPDILTDLAIDTMGNCYVGGWINGTTVMESKTLIATGTNQIFVAKYGAYPATLPSFITGSLQVSAGSFQFHLTGVPDQGQVVLEASPDLTNWSGFTTNPATGGVLNYSIPATNTPGLFFRAKTQP